MISKREAVLQALAARLDQATSGVPVLRNDVLPERIPERGLVILRDGDPGEPEVTLSPLRYHWQHRAEIELFSRQDVTEVDTMAQALGAIIDADRTMGGECDWVETEGLMPVVLPVDGATPIRAATLGIILHYSSESPLA